MRQGVAWLLALIIFLAMPFAKPSGHSVVFAAGSTTEVTLSDVGAGDLVFQRGYSSTDVWLPGPGPVTVTGGIFELRFDHVEHLNAQVSSMLVALNGHLLKTILLGDDNSRGAMISLDLPVEDLNPDVNHFLFNVWMTRTTDLCAGADDQSLWLTVSSKSRLIYQTGSPQQMNFDLKDLPTPFVAPWLPQPSMIQMAVPNDSDPSVLSGALTLAGELGQMSGGRPEDLEIVNLDQLASSTANVIVVGLPRDLQAIARVTDDWADHLTRNGWEAKEGGQSLPAGTGLIALAPSPWQAGKALLVVSGSDAVGLAKAIGVLGTSEGRATLTGNLAVIDNFVPAGAEQSNGSVSSFAGLGMADEQVSGIGNHGVDVRIPLNSRDVAGQTVIHLHMLASPLLDGDRSSVTVTFNGKTLTAERLPTNNPNQIDIAVIVPPGGVRTGFNTLGLTFSLYLPHMTACGAIPQEQAWATVLASSSIATVQGALSHSFDLSALPYPFVGGTTPTLFVLPDDSTQWSTPLQLAYTVGRSTRQPLNWVGVTASRFSPDQALDHEVVLYGTPQSNRWIDEVVPHLPVGLGALGRRSVSVKGVNSTQVTATGRWGVVEITESPWASSQALLLVAGSDATAADWAAAVAGQGGLSGPSVAVTGPTAAVPIRASNVAEMSAASPNMLRLALLGAFPLVLLTLLALGWRIWVRSRQAP